MRNKKWIRSEEKPNCINIGICFGALSVVAAISSQPIAILADKFGKKPTLIFGSVSLSAAMVLLSFADSFETLLLSLIPMALGSTVLSSVPIAMTGDIVKPHQRAQAISFLRFVGDIGFLLGAAFSGVIGQMTSIETTMQLNSAFIAAGIGLFLYRRRVRK